MWLIFYLYNVGFNENLDVVEINGFNIGNKREFSEKFVGIIQYYN